MSAQGLGLAAELSRRISIFSGLFWISNYRWQNRIVEHPVEPPIDLTLNQSTIRTDAEVELVQADLLLRAFREGVVRR